MKLYEYEKKHLEKMAMQHTLRAKSSKSTYPVPLLLENYIKIRNVYNLLNEHLRDKAENDNSFDISKMTLDEIFEGLDDDLGL